jgi:hypothetical protein
MNPDERAAFANAAYAAGLERVAGSPAPALQKFKGGTFVWVKCTRLAAMALGCPLALLYGKVQYSYAHAYGGPDFYSYSVRLRGLRGWFSLSWIDESDMTEISNQGLLAELAIEEAGIHIHRGNDAEN